MIHRYMGSRGTAPGRYAADAANAAKTGIFLIHYYKMGGKDRIRLEKAKKKEAQIEQANFTEERKLEKRRTVIDLDSIKKKLEIFYKFLDKFVNTLNKVYEKNTNDQIEKDLGDIAKAFISKQVHDDYLALSQMSDVELYISELLKYAIHFNQEMGVHMNNLQNSILEFFQGRTAVARLTPDSTFDLVPVYNEEVKEENKKQIRNYLTNMYKMTSQLNDEIDYDVITYIVGKAHENVKDVDAKKNDVISFYTSVKQAKHALKNLTGDTTGVVDDIVNTAADEFRNVQKEFSTLNTDEDEEFKDPEDFMTKNQELLKKVSAKVTNAFGNKLADGKIDINQFASIANNMMQNLGQKDKQKMTQKLGKIDPQRLKDLQKQYNGDFSKAVNMDSTFAELMKTVKNGGMSMPNAASAAQRPGFHPGPA